MKKILHSSILVTALLCLGGCTENRELETLRSEVRANQLKTEAAIDDLRKDIHTLATLTRDHERELEELKTGVQGLREKIVVSSLSEDTRLEQIEQETKRLRLNYVLLESTVSTKADASSVTDIELMILALKKRLEKVEQNKGLQQLSFPVNQSGY